ncbi:Fcf2 pre-rRNA processing-domain-containing protein [Roridomyces roridus]|uniref:Fcf2 pre-rRNA processing-domain-containing protein n=1 Tax=Roridomyces roridus TaxID=1738132 RepID=A0AAD7CAZ4_9AGAR|nr:Fcf2 pre-rRNA processing-domain-containing protein [Roridomyces roridus]
MSLQSKGKERATEPEITPEYLESLLQKARENARATQSSQNTIDLEAEEEDVIALKSEEHAQIVQLDPGALPRPYFTLGKRKDEPSSMRDPDVERAEQASAAYTVPAPPIPPPELTKSGKALTKRERKALKNQTAGPDWFDLRAPAEADLPRMHREVEALRLRNHLDPKRFYRKEEGEGKGIKGLPKYFAIGKFVTSDAPGSDNLPRSSRKRTLVDELVDDAEAKRYAKRKFEDLQAVRGAKGKKTLTDKNALRRPKW